MTRGQRKRAQFYRAKHRKTACAGKLRYRTVAEAELEIARASEYRGETLHTYTCPHCGNLHLTAMPAFRKD